MDNGTLFNLLLFAVFLMPWFIGTGPQLLELKPHQPRQDLDAMLQARERNRALKKAVATIVSNDGK
jgi:hypothetical protein